MANSTPFEEDPLLGDEGSAHSGDTTPGPRSISQHQSTIPVQYINRVLPIAFTAAFAIAATAASTVFAYASLMCEDPAHCQPAEQKDYAEVVALATTIANVCAIVAVGPLQQLIEGQPKIGLFLWLVFRALSILVLATGVLMRSIRVAIAGRLFEGLATDNLLHYTLAAIYVQSDDERRISKLMRTSLALYMLGMSVSPVLMSLLSNFFASFIVAVAILGISLVYLSIWIPAEMNMKNPEDDTAGLPPVTRALPSRSSIPGFAIQAIQSSISPIYHYRDEPKLLLPGLALSLYNTAQAYLFPAIMVHTAVHFGFTSTQNGYLISIAASVASAYLFATIYAIPRAKAAIWPTVPESGDRCQNNSIDNPKKRGNSGTSHTIGDLIYAFIAISTALLISTVANRNRIVKLRSACNQCCAAKVKCSGEKSGCERCRNTGTQCIYLESRVGKVPGIRAKKKPIQDHQAQRLQNMVTPSMERSLSPSDKSAGLNFQDQTQNENMEWSIPTEWDIQPSDTITMASPDDSSNMQAAQHSNTGTSSNSESITTYTNDTEISMSSIDANLEDFLAPYPTMAPPIEHASEIETTPQLQVSLGLRPRSEVDSQCCLECCHIISELENYIMEDLKVFKIIIGIVRTATLKLTQLMRLQQGSRNLRCLMLFTTLMYQILELLEVCLCAVAADKDKQRSRILPGGSGFGFEGFSIDAEEQLAFRTQTLLKEVRQATEALGSLKTLATVGPSSETGGGPDSAQGKARGDCQVDLEHRFKDLAVRCARKI
ncbi:hypothetical protein GL218_05724 [Daldinia childiae]|uniref:uncharacterized protein n=1 Tax=Daldinia childiae TaxID=326645 RepID=UPI001445BCC3|nr:uncharacterized protein GL218_05724 [Daldinia childiae]KAF3058431.1 hypothetical protein GL218_05724 [Daldinia childiae]